MLIRIAIAWGAKFEMKYGSSAYSTSAISY